MSDWRHVWTFEIKPPFKKQYRGLDAITRKKVDDAMRDLQGSENPALLGRYKQGMRIFSYDVGRKYRIIYNVNWDSNAIELLRVCDHKSVYRRD